MGHVEDLDVGSANGDLAGCCRRVGVPGGKHHRPDVLNAAERHRRLVKVGRRNAQPGKLEASRSVGHDRPFETAAAGRCVEVPQLHLDGPLRCAADAMRHLTADGAAIRIGLGDGRARAAPHVKCSRGYASAGVA